MRPGRNYLDYASNFTDEAYKNVPTQEVRKFGKHFGLLNARAQLTFL